MNTRPADAVDGGPGDDWFYSYHCQPHGEMVRVGSKSCTFCDKFGLCTAHDGSHVHLSKDAVFASAGRPRKPPTWTPESFITFMAADLKWQILQARQNDFLAIVKEVIPIAVKEDWPLEEHMTEVVDRLAADPDLTAAEVGVIAGTMAALVSGAKAKAAEGAGVRL